MPDGALPATAVSITTGAKLRARRTGVIRIQPRTGLWASILAGTGSLSRACRSSYSPLVATAILAPLVAGWRLPTFFLEEGPLQPSVLVAGLVVTMAVTF